MKKFFLPLLFLMLLPSVAFAAGGTLGLSNNTSTLTNGLIGYWPLDGNTINWLTGTVADKSGTGNNGTLVKFSTTTSSVSGKVGGALNFDGASTYIDLNTKSLFSMDASGTVSAWVKPTSLPGTDGGIVASWSGGTLTFLLFRSGGTNNVELVIRNGTAGSAIQFNSATTFKANQWMFITAVFSRSFAGIYINGKLDASVSGALVGIAGTGTVDYAIGNKQDAGAIFPGVIDEVRAYNRMLSSQEINQLYKNGLATVDHSNTTTLQSGLVGYWPLDGNLTNWNIDATIDASGNGNLGQMLNMATTTSPVTGKIGGALNFNGTNQTISVANSTSNNISGTTMSISVWVYPTSYGLNSLGRILDKNTGSGNGYEAFIDNSNVAGGADFAFNAGIGGTSDCTSSAGTVLLNKWQLITIVYDNGCTIYVNGSQVTLFQNASGSINASPSNVLVIGGRSSAADRNFQGKIDDVRVYNRALSSQEVKQLYTNGVATIGHSITTTASQTGLLMYYTFDGPKINWSTGSVLDSSGNAFTGSLISMSTSSSPAAGKIGQGLAFTGSASSLVLSPSLGVPPSSMSQAVWIKPNAAGGVVMDELGAASTGSTWHDSQIEVETNNTIKVCVWTGAVTCATAATGITYGKWYHVVLTYNSATQVLSGYVNGTLGGTTTGVARQAPTTNVIAYGIDFADVTNAGDGNAFSGVMDDVRVYNFALSASQVAALYQLGR